MKNEKQIPKDSSLKKGWKELAAAVGFCSAAALICGTASFYMVKAQYYEEHFFPNTEVNGVLVEGLTPKEAAVRILEGLSEYELTVQSRSGDEVIRGSEIGLQAECTDELKAIIREQNPYGWGKGLMSPKAYQISADPFFEEERLKKRTEELACFRGDLAVGPENARISDYIPGTGYEIIPEVQGQKLDGTKGYQAVEAAVKRLDTTVDLDAAGCYLAPEILSNDVLLEQRCAEKNRMIQTAVVYQFGENQEILDGEITHQWIQTGEDGSFYWEEQMIAQYVSDLASRYNTSGTSRYFQTSYGPTVKVSGPYGWKINEKEETDQLIKILEAGESQTREPVYAAKGASYSGADYGNTYAEVNLTAQHLFFYQDGKKVLESDFVSGNVRKNHTTPPGIFGLSYKQRDAVLKGEGYASPVDFWMPFHGGIGFHDASWRSSFGGSIYKTNGSHGCINMPYAKAEELYNLVYPNVPVICYNLEGTESKKAQGSSGTGASTPKPSQPSAPLQETTPVPPQNTETLGNQEMTPVPPTIPAPETGTDIPVITPAEPPKETLAETPAPGQTLPAAPSVPSGQGDGPVIIPVEESGEPQP